MPALYRAERIFTLTALLAIGLGMTLAISRGLLGRDLDQPATLLWVLAFTLVLVAGAGALWLRHSTQAATSTTLPGSNLPIVPVPLEVIVPATLVVGFVIFLQLFEDGIMQAAVVGLAGLSFAGVFWAQVRGADTSDRYFGLAQSVLNIISHLTAFLLFSAIYGLKVRALLSAPAVGIVTSLLIYEMLSRDATWHQALSLPAEGRRTTLVLLSLAAGVVASQITWGLNYWAALPTLIGGAFLLVVFYVMYGIASHYVDHTLSRQVVVEFSMVAALGLVVVFLSAFTQ
ncbi:MAG TPA: hypothetical protein VEX13_07510 [Chloroflexia bacterium]|nr:hypothetical protein [Chloroflexia bacterium]